MDEPENEQVADRVERDASPSHWSRLFHLVEGKTSLFRSILFNLLGITAAIVVVPIVVGELTGDRVTIAPIAVPATIAETGMDGAVVANRLWDAWAQVTGTLNISKEIREIEPSSQRIEFAIPDSGLSFGSLIQHVRSFFGLSETRIMGEMICAGAPCERANAALRLRVIAGETHVIQMPLMGSMDEDAYFRRAIAEVLLFVDPVFGILALRDGEDARAIAKLRRLVRERHADSAWALVSIGSLLAAKGNHAAAIENYDAALVLDHAFEDALIYRAASEAETGDLVAAMNSVRKAMAINPRSVRATIQMGEIQVRRGDKTAAEGLFARAGELAPNAPEVSFRVGMMHLGAGDAAKAKSAFETALDIDPDFSGAREGLALIAMQSGDYKAVALNYGEAARLRPDDAETHAAHALALANAGDFSGSARAYRRALEIEPERADWNDALGQSLQQTGSLQQALNAFETAAGLDGKVPGLWFRIGMIRQELGLEVQAQAAFQTYVLTEPDGVFAKAARSFLQPAVQGQR